MKTVQTRLLANELWYSLLKGVKELKVTKNYCVLQRGVGLEKYSGIRYGELQCYTARDIFF